MRKLSLVAGTVFAAATFAIGLAPAAGAATTTATVSATGSGFVWCGDHWERSRADGNDCGTTSHPNPGDGHRCPRDPNCRGGEHGDHGGHDHNCDHDHDGDHWHHWED